MDAVLELLLTVLGEVFFNMKSKNPRVRKWVLSGFVSVLGLLLVGTCAWGTALLFRQENAAGTAVLGAMTLVALIVSSVIIFRGHKRNWDKF